PYSSPDGSVPRIRLGVGAGCIYGGLLGFLALTLVTNVARVRYIEICHECGRPYLSNRRLPAKVNAIEARHYCDDHKHLANRNRVYESRRRSPKPSSTKPKRRTKRG